jgi:hypothetical protein
MGETKLKWARNFKLLPVTPRECNELEFDAGAEPDAPSAECGLRRDRIEYDDPSSETVCSRGYIMAEGCRPLGNQTDNGRKYTHHQTKRRTSFMRNRQSLCICLQFSPGRGIGASR